ncbi:MAG: type 1 glutamine amidotransferase [Nocardioidaceae bacterium]
MTLMIGWLYASRMNIYGDRGNVIALSQRARWRGIDVAVRLVDIGEPLTDEIDLYFFGGGQDQMQKSVAEDLQGGKGQRLCEAVDAGAALLAVCGGYQLLGHAYHPHAAPPMPGVGLFDVTTEAGTDRFIGNVIVDSQWGELVGFENHSGRTHLGVTAAPMGRVRVGQGNNGVDRTEGVVHRAAVGSYLHGSLLPKNPVLTDWLLEAAVRRRQPGVALAPLDDRLEDRAHSTAVARARLSHTRR